MGCGRYCEIGYRGPRPRAEREGRGGRVVRELSEGAGLQVSGQGSSARSASTGRLSHRVRLVGEMTVAERRTLRAAARACAPDGSPHDGTSAVSWRWPFRGYSTSERSRRADSSASSSSHMTGSTIHQLPPTTSPGAVDPVADCSAGLQQRLGTPIRGTTCAANGSPATARRVGSAACLLSRRLGKGAASSSRRRRLRPPHHRDRAATARARLRRRRVQAAVRVRPGRVPHLEGPRVSTGPPVTRPRARARSVDLSTIQSSTWRNAVHNWWFDTT